jgi:hypothetical protein
MLSFSNAYAWNDSTGTRSKKESTSVDANSVVNYGKYGSSITPMTVDANGSSAVVAGGYTTVKTVPITTTAGAYTAGFCIGGLQTVTLFSRVAVGSGIVNSIIAANLTTNQAAFGVVFFDSEPTGTTFTDHQALDIADADLNKILGVVQVLASNYQNFADNSVATVMNQGLAFSLPAGRTIYFTVIANSASTFAGIADLWLKIKQLQD